MEDGDTLSSIAARFTITVSAILSANEGVNIRTLRAGQELLVLPVAGVLHTRHASESLAAIAELYDIPLEDIEKWNPDPRAAKIIVPGAVLERSMADFRAQDLPRLEGYFIMPTTGLNWGQLHEENAVDIANACGTPVFAAADGLVGDVRVGYDSGYGTNIIIEHPNGIATRYAHLLKTKISAGEYVLQGDEIGAIGATGLVHGVTGCHLHFEVHGARNPFVR